MYSIASTTAQIATIANDTGTILSLVILGILGGFVALIGLGFAIKELSERIFGISMYAEWRDAQIEDAERSRKYHMDQDNWDVYMKTNYPW